MNEPDSEAQEQPLPEKSLKELFAQSHDRGRAGLPIMSLSMGRGLTPRNQDERRVETNLSDEQHRLVRAGELTYNMMRMWQGVCGLAEEDCLISPAYVVVSPLDGMDPKFSEYLLTYEETVAKFKRLSFGVVDDRLRLYFKDFQRVRVRVPSPAAQRKIAKILATLDNQIEKTEALIVKYQTMKQGMMHDLFTRGVDEQGHLRHPHIEAPHLYKPSPLGTIPKEWDLTQAQKLCAEITKGATPARVSNREGDAYIPFIRVQNLTFDGTLSFDGDQLFVPPDVHLHELGRSRVFPDDVLMNLVGPPLGKVSRVPSSYPEWNINQAIAIFRTLDPKDSDWLLYYLLTQQAYGWLLSRAKKTSGQMNLTLEISRQLPVPMPRQAAERMLIVSALSDLDNRINSEVLGLSKYRLLKTGLMQDLLTGKVRVQVDPAEEAAHA